jgi:ABC-type Co2+ transport system permease subunit
MTFLAPIANFGVLQKLIAPGDAAITAQNIAAAQGLFRLAIGAFFVVAVLDVVIGWALYIRFQAVNRSLSLLAALFRVVYATMLGVALTSLVSALQLVGGADFLRAFGTDQLQAQMMVLLSAFQSGWDL